MQKLQVLSAEVVGRHYKVTEFLPYFETLPIESQKSLLHSLDAYRLREFEANFFLNKDILGVTNKIWKRLLLEKSGPAFNINLNTYTFYDSRRARKEYWLAEFRKRLNQPDSIKTLMDDLPLFQDVIQVLKLKPFELRELNCSVILSLKNLIRFEIHHPPRNAQNWSYIVNLLSEHISLEEFGVFYGVIKEADIIDLLFEALLKRKLNSRKTLRSLSFIGVSLFDTAMIQLRRRLCQETYLTELHIETCLNKQRISVLDHLKHLTSLEKLILPNNDLTNDVLQLIVYPLKDLSISSIYHLDLSNNKLTQEGMSILSLGLAEAWNLRYLNLSYNPIGNNGIDSLSTGLSKNKSLLSLLIESCDISEVGSKALCESIVSHVCLRYLNIKGNCFDEGAPDFLINILTRIKQLEELQANWIGLTEAGCSFQLGKAIASNSSLKRLSLGANRLRLGGAKMICSALRNRCEDFSLEELDISGNLMGIDALDCIYQCFLESELIDKTTVEKKRKRILPLKLKVLDICDNFLLTDDESKILIEKLQKFIPEIRTGKVYHSCVYDDEV